MPREEFRPLLFWWVNFYEWKKIWSQNFLPGFLSNTFRAAYFTYLLNFSVVIQVFSWNMLPALTWHRAVRTVKRKTWYSNTWCLAVGFFALWFVTRFNLATNVFHTLYGPNFFFGEFFKLIHISGDTHKGNINVCGEWLCRWLIVQTSVWSKCMIPV